jgi:hypothetical protein
MQVVILEEPDDYSELALRELQGGAIAGGLMAIDQKEVKRVPERKNPTVL